MTASLVGLLDNSDRSLLDFAVCRGDGGQCGLHGESFHVLLVIAKSLREGSRKRERKRKRESPRLPLPRQVANTGRPQRGRLFGEG